MSELTKQKPRSTQDAEGSLSLKYMAAFVILAIVTLAAIVPFLIAILSESAPATRVSVIPKASLSSFGTTFPDIGSAKRP